MTTHLHTMAGQHHLEDMVRTAHERRAFLSLQGSASEQTNQRRDDDDKRRRFGRGIRRLRPAI
jgi:hypothetical protein